MAVNRPLDAADFRTFASDWEQSACALLVKSAPNNATRGPPAGRTRMQRQRGIGEIDAARMRAGHGQSDEAVAIIVVKVGRKARPLVAENQRIIRLEGAVKERARAVRC